MRNFVLLVISILLFQSTANAQYNLKENNVWALGYQSGLDFSSGVPVAIKTGMSYNGPYPIPEGCATVSNAQGSLLFYSSGDTIWNRNHQVMPNGYNLLPVPAGTPCSYDDGNGNTTLATSSTTQGVLIAPVLNNANQYYIFCLQENCFSDAQSGRLFYSIVDMTLNNGLGDVVATSKGTLIDSGLSEKMIAVPGDDCNLWVLVHGNLNDTFKAYEITKAGISAQPVKSTAGSIVGMYSYTMGVMKISPNRRKLAICSAGFISVGGIGTELCDFDPATGIVSNAQLLSTEKAYGACFSPDNTKLYISQVVYLPNTLGSVSQYDISLPTLTAMQNSRFDVIAHEELWVRDMQLGPDGKIYSTIVMSTALMPDSLSVINFPNLLGAACGFVNNGVGGISGTQLGTGMPNMYMKPLQDTVFNKLDTVICKVDNAVLKGRAGSTAYKWNNGATSAAITISQRGTYWVLSTNDCHTFADTFVVGGADIAPAVISINGFTLSTTSTYNSYQWYKDGTLLPNETNATYTITQNGVYSVKVSNTYGCVDSASKTVTNVSVMDIAQLSTAIKIYPNPTNGIIHILSPIPVTVAISSIDGRNVAHSADGRNINIAYLAEGFYMLRIMDSEGNIIKTEKIVKTK